MREVEFLLQESEEDLYIPSVTICFGYFLWCEFKIVGYKPDLVLHTFHLTFAARSCRVFRSLESGLDYPIFVFGILLLSLSVQMNDHVIHELQFAQVLIRILRDQTA